ncbi:hypothetical protein U472_00295 [Orenia metallireducens]|uniref:Uncharacterized protein n=1 Tax=Orenia metallireducens TaxID=1413210 RepID=A0A1C0ADC3_9FIRM|nr:zinc ribbon domain-containing protein [Orenia metallireducens]OCL28631.1 hypothetical protein U472_00295 [Orenia metallireducens]
MSKCPKCNKELSEEAKFCSECGEEITNISNKEHDSNNTKNTEPNEKNVADAKKGCLGCFGFIVIISIILAGIGSFFSNDVIKVTADEKELVKDISYSINGIGDYSFSTAKRYSVDVVVNEPVGSKELETISKIVAQKVKEEHDFNALIIGFYDYPEYINNGYTLGKATLAPEGDWSKADTVDTGQYNKMKFNYEFRDKDWANQLTKQEVRVWSAWKRLYKKVAENDISKIPDENEITNTIAERFNTTVNKVEDVLNKQIDWTYEDKK